MAFLQGQIPHKINPFFRLHCGPDEEEIINGTLAEFFRSAIIGEIDGELHLALGQRLSAGKREALQGPDCAALLPDGAPR